MFIFDRLEQTFIVNLTISLIIKPLFLALLIFLFNPYDWDLKFKNPWVIAKIPSSLLVLLVNLISYTQLNSNVWKNWILQCLIASSSL